MTKNKHNKRRAQANKSRKPKRRIKFGNKKTKFQQTPMQEQAMESGIRKMRALRKKNPGGFLE